MEGSNKMVTYETGTLKTTKKKTLFVRALYDFDASRDSSVPGRGLSFQHGDVLHIINAGDEEWWQARRLMGPPADLDKVGIVPSKTRVERRERFRAKNVKFVGKESDSAGTLSGKKKKHLFGRRLHLSRSKERSKSENALETDAPITTSIIEPSVPSYETVTREDISYCRPVVLLGLMKDVIGDSLIHQHPSIFETCVPHTTRSPKDGEVGGRDYHFVKSRKQMEMDMRKQVFIEAGEYNKHLYGTSISAVKEVALRGKHCLLDVSGNALERLRTTGIHPISIFIKPRSVETIMEYNRILTYEQARIAYEKLLSMEKLFGTLFSAIVVGGSQEEICGGVEEAIRKHSMEACVWLSVAGGNAGGGSGGGGDGGAGGGSGVGGD